MKKGCDNVTFGNNIESATATSTFNWFVRGLIDDLVTFVLVVG
jgi:hypothetical protein